MEQTFRPELCGVCRTKHPPFLPDNRTRVPCCDACWEKVPVAIRLQMLVACKQNETWESLVSIINGWLDEKVSEIVREKLDDRQVWGDN